MDAIMLLTADHNRFRGQFLRFREAHDKEDTRLMREVAERMIADLDVHARIEEDVFCPAIMDADDELRHEVLEGIEEHHVMRVLAGKLTDVVAGSERWTAKVVVIIESTEHHLREEDDVMFSHARRLFDYARMFELGEHMERARASQGAPTMADKEKYSTDQLHGMASEQAIPRHEDMDMDMDREELLATVAPAWGRGPVDPRTVSSASIPTRPATVNRWATYRGYRRAPAQAGQPGCD